MINSVGYHPISYMPQKQTHLVFTDKEKKNKDMSNTSKALLGLGALAAVCIGGLLIRKRIDDKFFEKFLIKTDNVDAKFMSKITEEWRKAGKLETGDAMLIIPKKEILKHKGLASETIDIFLKKMSDKGFAAMVQKSDGSCVPSTIKYFSPKEVSYEDINKSIKDNVTRIVKIENL